MNSERGGFRGAVDNDDLDDAFSRRLTYSAARLPGQTWESGNMFTHGMFVPNCNMDEGVYMDPVWRDGSPDRLVVNARGREVLSALFYSDPVRRLQAIEQLTLPPQYSTVPNTGAFSRFEHIWGSALLVEQLSKTIGLGARETIRNMLRTAVSDVGHTTGSHKGDWMFQGVGGPENQHDLDLWHYLEATGVNDIFRNHGFDPEEVVFPPGQDWVEADQPDLCIDRVDFYTREANRTNQSFMLESYSSKDFVITPENTLAMKSLQRARYFAESALLVAQENWSEPTHRAVLDLFILRSKLFYADGGAPREWVFDPTALTSLIPLDEIHPRDLMYFTDSVELQAFAYPSLVGNTLEAMMSAISQYHRQYVWPGRNRRINQYLEQFRSPNYGEVLSKGSFVHFSDSTLDTFRDQYPGTLPLGFSIVEGVPEPREDCIDIPQPPFKKRQIDPLVQNGKRFQRLSELDPSYGVRLEEHALAVSSLKTARFAIPDPRTAGLVQGAINNTEAEWRARLQNSRRLTPDELKELVRVGASRIHGQYPFMTFFDY